jgi:hypothetical protein
MERDTAEPLLFGPSCLEAEIAITKLKKYKSPSSDQIPPELIQAGGETVSVIHKLVNSIWNKEVLHDQWKGTITVPYKFEVFAVVTMKNLGCYAVWLL